MAFPVTVVASGGLPVVESPRGFPVTVAPKALPVTLSTNGFGLPVFGTGPPPNYAVTFGNTGRATANAIPAGLNGINNKPVELEVDFTLTQADIDNSAFFMGVWGSTGYVQSFQINFYNGLKSVSVLWHDNSGNVTWADSNTLTPVVGMAYSARAKLYPGTGTPTEIYLGPKGGTLTNIGTQSQGNTNNYIGTASEDPSTHELPFLTLGSANGQGQLRGSLSRARIVVAGVEIINTTATATGFTDTHGVTWTLSGGAVAS